MLIAYIQFWSQNFDMNFVFKKRTKKCGQTNLKISKYYRINGLAIFVNN